jgi:hypothetical protein
MLSQEITTQHILSAIQRYDSGDKPLARDSEMYDVFYHGKLYPPKVIISFAYEAAIKKKFEPKDFKSNIPNRNFLMERGFPILVKSEHNTEDQFTREDVFFFWTVKDIVYDPNNLIDRNKAEYIKKYLWSRSKHWAQLIASNKQFKISGGTHWNTRKGKAQGFKKYSWYKLHPINNYHSQIFYAVGVDAREKSLVLKLDCQRDGSNPLAKAFQVWFDNLKREQNIEWWIYNYRELSTLNWEDLVEQSRSYISDTLPIYLEAISYVTNQRIKKCARICWNENGWESPSGSRGKSITAAASQDFIHERDNGFAPEEWLLDLNKSIEGYHYSRIEPVNTKTGKHVGKTYDLIFYAFNSINSK